MLKQSEILQATKIKLKEIANIPVYLNEVKESYESPCFFLKLVKTVQPENESVDKYLNKCLIGIAYFARKGTHKALELYDIQDVISRKFRRGLRVGKRWLHFQEIDGDIVGKDDDIVEMALSFVYLDADEDDDLKTLPIIGDIYQAARLKGETEFYDRNGVDVNGEA